jgi:arginyl-tRNA synthetase
MIKEEIQKILQQAAKQAGVHTEVTLDIPTQKEYGDYATSVALKSVKELKKAPFLIAEDIVKHIEKKGIIRDVKVIKPGFINLWIDPAAFVTAAEDLANGKFTVEPAHLGPEKKVMVEFAHPNTHKLFHIGHLRNIATGESVVRLLEAAGNKVIRSNYQGDVGLHIAKTLYSIRKDKTDLASLKTLTEKIKLLGAAYAKGQQEYDEVPGAKDEIHNINKMIYEKDPAIVDLWTETVKWSLEYFNEIYKRVYSTFDRCYFESEMYKRGTEIVHDLLSKGILKKSEGAVVFDGTDYGTDTRVFINSLGFPTYEGKELALAEKEFADFGTLDRNIHVVTPEQTSFFQVTFKVEELIDPAKYKGKQYHLAYNWVKLKSGKMSSRTGNVIEGTWLIDEAKGILLERFKIDEETAEILAVAAVKYSFLKVSTSMEIYFDFEESITLEGNSAPYLNYTYVRTRSVLGKEQADAAVSLDGVELNDEDRMLAKKLYMFPGVVHEAAQKLSPNIVATYLFELSQDFNLLYQKNPILKAEGTVKALRLMLTKATGNTIHEGLRLLGIKTVQKM